MKRALSFIFVFWLTCSCAFGAFTEFYCNASTGANINAGDLTANGVVTSTNGAWSTVTNIFTATSGTPFSGVSVGDFASVYTDGSSVTGYVARVTAVGGGGLTLTLSSTAKSGTAPTTAATGISCTTGGAWKGPNGTVGFPFNFAAATMTDSAGDYPCVNMKNGTTYAITAATTHAIAGPVRFQGYTTTVRDGGRAIFDGGTSGASYVLLTCSGNDNDLEDIIFQNNGATGIANGVLISGNKCVLRRIIVHDVRGFGVNNSSNYTMIIESETYACNGSNSTNTGGISSTLTGAVIRCVSHDNAGSNSCGFSASFLIDSIADTNGGKGCILNGNAVGYALVGDEFYNNTGDGLDTGNFNANGKSIYVENCNFVKNGGWGINRSGIELMHGAIVNCGFGSGSQANGSGDIASALGGVLQIGKVTYASGVTPWVDPANGNFNPNLAAAKGAGRGNFTQTQSGYTGTIGYPDIGAAQHQDAGGSGISRSRTQ